jgi:hypothetical protein
MGDLNGDFKNDESDFALFKLAYDELNGAGALSALQAPVPEPATLTFMCSGALVYGACQRFRCIECSSTGGENDWDEL